MMLYKLPLQSWS